MGSLPLKSSEWRSSIDNNYYTYEDFKRELIVKPKVKSDEQQKKVMDHPLSRSNNSVWNTFFTD